MLSSNEPLMMMIELFAAYARLQVDQLLYFKSDIPCSKLFLCPQRNFGRHIVIALSVRQSVRPSVRQSVRPAFVSGPYLLYSLI